MEKEQLEKDEKLKLVRKQQALDRKRRKQEASQHHQQQQQVGYTLNPRLFSSTPSILR